MKAYILQHVRGEDEDQDYKICGIYSSYEMARMAIQRYIKKPGFKENPNGFHIGEYEVNKDEWAEGFGFDPEEIENDRPEGES